MVNYRRVICEVVVLLAVVSINIAAPVPDCPHAYIDQRQNGTENYRLSIDGVVIAVAPAETLLDAASDLSELFSETDLDVFLKPPPPHAPSKPEESKPEESKPEESNLKPESENPNDKPISDVSLESNLPAQKKDASVKKQEKAQRLKNRLANVLIPLLRRTRHH
ncbi:unnamed protein product, partial [Brenthis ino]